MAQITVKNVAGADAGTVELDAATFGIQPNVPVMHQVVTAQLAAPGRHPEHQDPQRGPRRRRQAVPPEGHRQRPSGLDPRTALLRWWRGPRPEAPLVRPEDPKKMIKLALRSALSDRAGEGKVVVVVDWGWDTPSTKSAVGARRARRRRQGPRGGRSRRCRAALSFRNLPEVQLIAPGELNAYDVLCNDWIVFTEGTLPPPLRVADASRRRGRPPRTEMRHEGPTRHHHRPDRLREELRPDGDRRLHLQGAPVRHQARDPRRRRVDLGRRGLQGQHAEPPGKRRRTRGTNRSGKKPDTKRAIVTLAAGEIPLFEN
jgi:large subunit ribosomal protein L4